MSNQDPPGGSADPAAGPALGVAPAPAASLRGPLAQFARGPVVRAFVDEMASMVAKNLAARLRGEVAAAPRRMGGVGLLVRILWRRVRIVFGR